jgi:SAM-dependent methyltransferase
MARAGSALGVDISETAIERARELAEAQGVRNVSFEVADAQVHWFGRERFDLVISRFGTMFFAEPVAGFSNIGRALRPGGRLVMMVWQAGDRNEWHRAIQRCLDGPRESVASAGPDPFSLADPAVVTGVLETAGFGDVALTDVREPMYFGPDVATALEWVRGFACTREALDRLDSDAAAGALGRLRVMLTEHRGGKGIRFDSRAWLVTARR